MQVLRRPLARREIDHELLWLLVSLGGFLVLALWLQARLPVPRCLFHDLTTWPCPTCGATRAAWQFLHGHFATSFHFNPLAFLACCAILAFDLYALLVLLCRVPRFRLVGFTRGEKVFLRGAALALLFGNWLYLLSARPF